MKLTKREKKMEALFNTIEYDADTMPTITMEIDDSEFLMEDVTFEELNNFKSANALPMEWSQGEVEGWLDQQIK